MTNDALRVAVDLDTSQYEEVISTLKGDLLLVESQKKEFTPVSELHQIGSLLDTLEFKLVDFYQILPKLDSRRGLINLGGTILETLFGTATVTDINLLHETIDKLKSNNADISHSLTDQITYNKKLDAANKINSNAIANLSGIVKKVVIQFHGHSQQLIRYIMWMNITFYDQSNIFLVIRQLEFALLRLIQQLNELFEVVQCMIQGKLPVKLINPTALHNILRNVSS